MKRFFILALMAILLPSAALADQTQITGTSVQTSITTEYVDASLELGVTGSGFFSGVFSNFRTFLRFNNVTE